MQTRLLKYESLSSTNLELSRLATEGAEEGLCVVAEEQTAGRGRLARQWISPRRAGLYFSMLLRPSFDQKAWPLLTLMASVAVSDALSQVFDIATDIKWPNDVLANERKLCGILAETVETVSGRAVILGIGINLKNEAFPRELEEVATSVSAVSGKPASSEVLIEPLIEALKRRYQILSEPKGMESTIQAWSSRSSYAAGKQVRVQDGTEIIEGTTRGLTDDGALQIETTGGEIRTVRTGDVTRLRALD